MLKAGSDLNFREEPLATDYSAELRIHNLDSDSPVVLGVPGEINGRHSAGADLALDGVSISEFRAQVLDGRHARNTFWLNRGSDSHAPPTNLGYGEGLM